MTTPPPMRRISAAALLASLVAVSANHAFAHAIPLESDPSDGAIVIDSPKEVRLRLSERVLAQFSTVQLLDASGRVMAGIEIPIEQREPNLLVFTLPKLSDGAYALFWKTFSKDDGHFSKGLLLFGVGPGADLTSAVLPKIDSRPALLDAGVRWLNLGLLLMLVGAISVVGLVFGHRPECAVRPLLRAARVRTCAWAAGCGCAAFVAAGLLLLFEATALLSTQPAETPLWLAAWQVLHDTRWGGLWLARQVLLLFIIGAAFLLHRRADAIASTGRPVPSAWQDVPWLSAATLAVALVTTQALSGHAGSVGDGAAWAVTADVLHLCAASIWVGGMFALAYSVLPLLRRERANFAALARASWGAFSRPAAVAVTMLLATGFYAIGRQVASLDALITTFYGLSILAKVALVLAMGAIGVLNASLLHPDRIPPAIARLAHRTRLSVLLTLAHLPRLIRLDMCIAMLVLALTGAITASAPPLGAEFIIAREDVRQQQSRVVDDMTVTLSAKPGHPGQNLLTVFAGSSIRPAKAEIVRIMLRFAFEGRDLGHLSATAEMVEPGRYVVAGRHLSVAGKWLIDVVVRRSGIPDAVVPFEWIVPPAAELPPTIVSKQPIRSAARTLSVAVLLLAFGAIVVRLVRDRVNAGSAASAERSAGTAESAHSTGVVSTLTAL